MKKIQYTPDAADKLRAVKRKILLEYGSEKAKNVVGKITYAIRGQVDYAYSGQSVEYMFGVASDYRYIFVAGNYVFFSIDSECIKIINIYNEKEDFMWLLFEIDTTSLETLDYWN